MIGKKNNLGRGDKRGIGDLTVSEYAAAKFDWLRRIATDDELPARAPRIAIILATDFLRHDKGGIAFMSQETLANRLRMSRQRTSTTLALMEKRGHLVNLSVDGLAKKYIIGPGNIEQNQNKNNYKTDGCAETLSSERDTSDAATCHDMGSCSEPDPEPKSLQPLSPERDNPCHDMGSQKDRRIITGELKTGIGSLRSQDAREAENGADKNLIKKSSPAHAGKIEAVGSSQEALQKDEPKAAAKPMKTIAAGKIAKPDQGELILAPTPAHPSDVSLPADLIEPFGVFYAAFPFARDRGDAREVFKFTIRSGKATADELIDGARNYAAERSQDTRAPATVRQFTRTPAKWLRAEGWTNAPAPAPAPEVERARFNGSNRNYRAAAVQAYDAAMFATIAAAVTDKTDDSGF